MGIREVNLPKLDVAPVKAAKKHKKLSKKTKSFSKSRESFKNLTLRANEIKNESKEQSEIELFQVNHHLRNASNRD